MKVLLGASLVVLLFAGTALAGWGDPSCPSGWQTFNNTRCFSLFTREEPWVEARRQCKFAYEDADLAVVDSEEKKIFIHTMIHSKPPFLSCGILGMDSYWIGGNDRRKEFTFEWLDFETPRLMKPYTNWGFLEPNGWLGQDCVEMEYDEGEWNDKDCDNKLCFLCEKPMS